MGAGVYVRTYTFDVNFKFSNVTKHATEQEAPESEASEEPRSTSDGRRR